MALSTAPLVACTDPAIPRRWMSGNPTILWLGDSISTAFMPYIFSTWPVTVGGVGFSAGATYTDFSAPAWTSAYGPGGLGTAGPAGFTNHSLFSTQEAVFNGNAVAAGGGPAAWQNRLFLGGNAYTASTRTDNSWDAIDWLNGNSVQCRSIWYKNATGSNGVVRHTNVDEATPALFGASSFLNLNGASGYVAADGAAFTPALTTERLSFTVQAPSAGITPVLNSNAILCCAILKRADATGMTVINAAVGGNQVSNYNDTAKIAASAWNILPLLTGVTDVVIALTNNGTPATSAFLALVATIRAQLPNASITFVSTWDNDPGDAHDASVQNAYAAQQQTSNSMWLNLYDASGAYLQLKNAGYFIGGGGNDFTHPNQAGVRYSLGILWSLITRAAFPIAATVELGTDYGDGLTGLLIAQGTSTPATVVKEITVPNATTGLTLWCRITDGAGDVITEGLQPESPTGSGVYQKVWTFTASDTQVSLPCHYEVREGANAAAFDANTDKIRLARKPMWIIRGVACEEPILGVGRSITVTNRDIDAIDN